MLVVTRHSHVPFMESVNRLLCKEFECHPLKGIYILEFSREGHNCILLLHVEFDIPVYDTTYKILISEQDNSLFSLGLSSMHIQRKRRKLRQESC